MASSGDTFAIAPGSAAGQRYLIVEARFYDDIADALLEGAKAAFEAAGASCDVITVPGALEIPAAIAIASDLNGDAYDGYVALGCVIRGETTHYEIVSSESARALMNLSIGERLAIGYGILTVNTLAQALVRADPARGDKGGEATRAALAMIALRRRFAETGR